jgi:hypothetical protein
MFFRSILFLDGIRLVTREFDPLLFLTGGEPAHVFSTENDVAVLLVAEDPVLAALVEQPNAEEEEEARSKIDVKGGVFSVAPS